MKNSLPTPCCPLAWRNKCLHHSRVPLDPERGTLIFDFHSKIYKTIVSTHIFRIETIAIHYWRKENECNQYVEQHWGFPLWLPNGRKGNTVDMGKSVLEAYPCLHCVCTFESERKCSFGVIDALPNWQYSGMIWRFRYLHFFVSIPPWWFTYSEVSEVEFGIKFIDPTCSFSVHLAILLHYILGK